MRFYRALGIINQVNNKGIIMEYEEFKKVLKKNNLTLKKFSELSGVKYNTCARWGKDERPVSDWVESWLKFYEKSKGLGDEEYKELLQLKELLGSIFKKELSH